MEPNRLTNTNRSFTGAFFKDLLFPSIEKMINRKLEYTEKQYIERVIKQINPEHFVGRDYRLVADTLAKMSVEKLVRVALAENELSSYMRATIGISTPDDSFKFATSAGPDSISIDSFMGYKSAEEIASAIKNANVKARQDKIYIVLDSFNRSLANDGTSYFQWYYFNSTSLSNGTVNSIDAIRNIKSIKVYPFKLPYPTEFNVAQQRISLLISELSSQSFIMQEERLYHVMFKATVDDPETLNLDPYEISEGVFAFNKSFTEIDKLTITFADPITPIQFKKDRMVVQFAPIGVQWGTTTKLIFSESHGLLVGDVLILDSFGGTPVLSYTNKNVPNPLTVSSVSSATEVVVPLDTRAFNAADYSASVASGTALNTALNTNVATTLNVGERVLINVGEYRIATIASVINATQFTQTPSTDGLAFYMVGGSGSLYKSVGSFQIIQGDSNVYAIDGVYPGLVGDVIVLDLGDSLIETLVVDIINPQHIRIADIMSRSATVGLFQINRASSAAITTGVFVEKRRMFIPIELTLLDESMTETIE
jgi:hypothetical protein